MRAKFAVYALLLLALVAAGIFAYQQTRITVAVARPSRGPAVEAVYATATVEPVRWAKVSPRVAGRIVAVLAAEGERVARGTVLARLDDQQARANLEQLAARERFLRNEVARLAPLAREQYVSQQDYERAVSEHRQAQAALAAARQPLADLILRSPLDGVVLQRDGEVGEVADTKDVLFWVGQERPLRVTAEVDEEDVPLVRPGQRALIKADAFAERSLAGRVQEITPRGDPVNKSYRVRIALPDDTPLRIGMTTEVNIIVREQRDALLVPSSAVADRHVWVVRDGKARRVPVRTGVVGDSRTEIQAGLRGDETVIVHPPSALRDGDAVRIAPPRT